jgi:hypothetical protein
LILGVQIAAFHSQQFVRPEQMVPATKAPPPENCASFSGDFFISPSSVMLEASLKGETFFIIPLPGGGRALRNSPVGCFSEGASLQGQGWVSKTVIELYLPSFRLIYFFS